MQEDDEEKTDLQGPPPEDQPDFIQEFIERKKLENRVLGEILDKIKQSEINHKSQSTNQNKKS